jgi:adenosylmethionine-8-amino-7-oxononanoate aminotransferase
MKSDVELMPSDEHQELRRRARRHVRNSFTDEAVLDELFLGAYPRILVGGEGAHLIDADGLRVLDAGIVHINTYADHPAASPSGIAAFRHACYEAGAWVRAYTPGTILFYPPLCVSRGDVDFAFSVLRDALRPEAAGA